MESHETSKGGGEQNWINGHFVKSSKEGMISYRLIYINSIDFPRNRILLTKPIILRALPHPPVVPVTKLQKSSVRKTLSKLFNRKYHWTWLSSPYITSYFWIHYYILPYYAKNNIFYEMNFQYFYLLAGYIFIFFYFCQGSNIKY